MAFSDLLKDFRGLFAKVRGDETRRPDGGTSHYRPLRRKSEEGPQVPPRDEGNVPYLHTGFTGMNPPSAYGFETPAAPSSGARWNGGMGEDPLRGENGYFGGRTAPAPRQDNISYMPGYGPGVRDHGMPHVEHIMALTGLKSCYEAIECMKNGETLIVTLDAIANESESMRCQDMLAGAAFTLGCTVRLLSGARVVVIAPEGVVILPEQFAPEAIRPEAAPVRPAQPEERPARQRRTGPGNARWNAARNGELDNYNPYTGTMPVAAGSYTSFGGYR